MPIPIMSGRYHDVSGRNMRSAGFLSSLRRWLDGEEAVAEVAAPAEARSEWDDFFVLIAREVEAVMRREMFTPPGGPTYLPGEYIIYLSREDDLLWQGRKREGLAEGLRHSLAIRAREMVGDKPLRTERLIITLGADGTLEKGQVRVQEVWDDDSPRTEVAPRARPATAERSAEGEPARGAELEEERTMILPRTPRFVLRYWQGAGEVRIFTAARSRIEIGRGAKDLPVDLKLEGDQEISRRQAVLERLPTGRFRIECVGRNPIEVEGRELPPGESLEFDAGQSFRVGLFNLQIESGVAAGEAPVAPRRPDGGSESERESQ